MIPPSLSFQRFSYGLLVGAVLGIWYGFLRPLRRNHGVFGDVLFLLAAAYGWIFLQFDLCQTDIRMAYSAAMLIGIFAWECTAGWLLRPVFLKLWTILEKLWEIILLPYKKTLKMTKILFASVKKWVTIRWSNRRLT